MVRTKYRNHYAVDARRIYEGDHMLNRRVTEVIENLAEDESTVLSIQFRLHDGGLVVAKPSEVFPVQFPEKETATVEYRTWTIADPLPKGIKMNERPRNTGRKRTA